MIVVVYSKEEQDAILKNAKQVQHLTNTKPAIALAYFGKNPNPNIIAIASPKKYCIICNSKMDYEMTNSTKSIKTTFTCVSCKSSITASRPY
jgi:protein associated with RNAse G/E